jgi:hypothetical protein
MVSGTMVRGTVVRGTMVSAPDHLAVPRLLQEFQGTKLASWRFDARCSDERRLAPPPGAPELLRQTPAAPNAIVIQRQPTADNDRPGVRRVPDVSSLPGMSRRPIARHVRIHGIDFDIPAIVVVGAPYVIDVPGLGWVYVPEDEYPELFAMLTSDDPDQVEAAYERLQQLASVQ